MTTRPSRHGAVHRHPAPATTSTAAGWIVLVLVGVLTVATSSIARPGVAGRPARLPLLSTPVVGACLLIHGPAVILSSCDDPHHAEVTRTWSPGQPVPSRPPADEASTVAPEPDDCVIARSAYLNEDATDASGTWTVVSPEVRGRMIAVRDPFTTERRFWHACLVGAVDGRPYAGTLRDGFRTGRRPDTRFASCAADRATSAGIGRVSCETSHTIEILGSFRTETLFDGTRYVNPPSPDALAAACARLARSVTGTEDPTFSGRLRVVAEPLTSEPVVLHRPDDNSWGSTGFVVTTRPSCFLELAGQGVLRSTVIGLGDGELPVD